MRNMQMKFVIISFVFGQSLASMTYLVEHAVAEFASAFFYDSYPQLKNLYDLEKRNLAYLSEDYFVEAIELLPAGDPDLALTKHEYYAYPSFRSAIKKKCPYYAHYIKELKYRLDGSCQARCINGFKPVKRGSLLTRYIREYNHDDFYPFYEMVKKLYADVMQEEKQRDIRVLSLLNALPVVYKA